MTAARCRWCGQTATARCRAKGTGQPVEITYCDPETPCWESTYRQVRRYPERTWTTIERTSRRAPQPGPDLFDQLPKGTTP